jgi:hypothetical protein
MSIDELNHIPSEDANKKFTQVKSPGTPLALRIKLLLGLPSLLLNVQLHTYYQNRDSYYQNSKYIIKMTLLLSNLQNRPPRNIFSQPQPPLQNRKACQSTAGFSINL